MNKYLVITTINSPTKATLAYCEREGWNVIVVGDTKTPHAEYQALEKKYPHVRYMTPEIQEEAYPELSACIGWKTIRRRNIGFVEAYRRGADILATVDDDNIPLENWGKKIYVGNEIICETYTPEAEVFDPLSVTKENHVWHRGYPIQLLDQRLNVEHVGNTTRKVLVQANLWNGDPDVDAIARLCYQPEVTYTDITGPYCSTVIAPFNSQNTFLSREVIPYYAVLPGIGRMDDIWMSYILQHMFPDSVVYDVPTVYQDRNEQDLITNLEDEIIGYRKTLDLVRDIANYELYLPDKTKQFYDIYRKQFEK